MEVGVAHPPPRQRVERQQVVEIGELACHPALNEGLDHGALRVGAGEWSRFPGRRAVEPGKGDPQIRAERDELGAKRPVRDTARVTVVKRVQDLAGGKE